MATKKAKIVPYRRKREGKTNYKKRLKFLVSEKPRFIVRKSLKNINIQIVSYAPTGDIVLASASSKDIEKLGWKTSRSNIPAAYLVGFLAGKKAKDKKISEAILDIGLNTAVKESKLFAALKGAVDAGLPINHDPEMLPREDRINGKHIAEYAKKIEKEDKEKYNKLFSAYIKNNVDPKNMDTYFNDMKKKIIK